MAKNHAHRAPARIAAGDSVAVLGLGRFGTAVALDLAGQGIEVLGVDADPDVVQAIADDLAFAAQADTTDVEALRQLAIPDFDRVVVGIGSNLAASIVTASHLVDFGIGQIWCKAVSADQVRILRRLGISEIIEPEVEVGRSLATTIGRAAGDDAAGN